MLGENKCSFGRVDVTPRNAGKANGAIGDYHVSFSVLDFRDFLTKHAWSRYSPNLDLLLCDSKNVHNMIVFASHLAEDVSGKVRQLDLAKVSGFFGFFFDLYH